MAGELSADELHLMNDWIAACGADPRVNRFPTPDGALDLVTAVYSRVCGDAQSTPLPALEGAGVGFAASRWELPSDVLYLQLEHLVRQALRRDSARPEGALDAIATAGSGLIRTVGETWKNLALEDALTRLPNRFAMERTRSGLVHDGRHFEYASIDIDGLKAINDDASGGGHEAGDLILKACAATLTRFVVAPGTTAYRYGGDEFGVLRSSEPGEATLHADLQAARLGAEHPLAFSWGVSKWPDDDEDPHAVVTTADRRMYDMKNAQGNDQANGAPLPGAPAER